ncbi:MAG: DUF4097 family beta strand repeat-containing protein, partial [Pyrinomonadaceae bacterium]
MSNTDMNKSLRGARCLRNGARRMLVLFAAISILSSSSIIFAQKRFSKTYPAHRNVKLQLTNRTGTIVVEGWNRDEIKISADMDSPAARLVPEAGADGLVIDVARDNRGRDDVGDVNFKIWVPANSTVDLETKRGNITVNGVSGNLVRAHVTSEGDIELTGIRAMTVMAQNTVGNIVFDGELANGGTYEFKSWKGDISISIPADSTFSLVASNNSKKIMLGAFWNDGMKKIGDGRRIT